MTVLNVSISDFQCVCCYRNAEFRMNGFFFSIILIVVARILDIHIVSFSFLRNPEPFQMQVTTIWLCFFPPFFFLFIEMIFVDFVSICNIEKKRNNNNNNGRFYCVGFLDLRSSLFEFYSFSNLTKNEQKRKNETKDVRNETINDFILAFSL